MKTETEIITDLIAAVRRKHRYSTNPENGEGWCLTCMDYWPCLPERAAEALKSEQARAEAFQSQLYAEQSDNADLRARIEALQERGGGLDAG